MGLEQLLIPFKIADNGIKILHDAAAAATIKVGVDRFTLASVVGGLLGLTFAIDTVQLLAADEATSKMLAGGAISGLLGGGCFVGAPWYAQRMRNYFAGGRNVLNTFHESVLFTMRSTRLLAMAQSLLWMSNVLPDSYTAKIPSSDEALSLEFALIGSYYYFMDGDRSLWDITKNFVSQLTSSRRLYRSVHSYS